MGDPGSIPGSGRSPGEGKGNPLQYSCLENSMDRGAWWATVYGITKSWTRLSDFTFFLSIMKLNIRLHVFSDVCWVFCFSLLWFFLFLDSYFYIGFFKNWFVEILYVLWRLILSWLCTAYVSSQDCFQSIVLLVYCLRNAYLYWGPKDLFLYIGTEILWPIQPRIFPLWSFVEKVWRLL